MCVHCGLWLIDVIQVRSMNSLTITDYIPVYAHAPGFLLPVVCSEEQVNQAEFKITFYI